MYVHKFTVSEVKFGHVYVIIFSACRNVSRDGKFWIDDGCTTITFDNGSIMCSCNHLTHFAILLSPGVSVSTYNQDLQSGL